MKKDRGRKELKTMGQNDSEIFSRLRKIGEGVKRIDERTRRGLGET